MLPLYASVEVKAWILSIGCISLLSSDTEDQYSCYSSCDMSAFLTSFPPLEKGDVKLKTEALKKVIIMILNGEKLPGLLMTIIRFVLPLQDHTIKKLLLVFWEIVPKTTPDGRLLQEMILVCDAYRKVPSCSFRNINKRT